GAGLLDNPREYWKGFGAFKDMHDRLRELGKPTVARVQGIAVGGGNELQMACDLAVMVDDTFIRHVGPEHGSVPAGGATQWLPVIVGDRRAREILFLCEEIPARRAEEWGLVNRAVPREELDATVGVLRDLDHDDGIRCIVLAGDERAFAGGADIDEMANASAVEMLSANRVERWDAIRKLWTPLVAAVSGYCLGGGCELAMACDLVV